MLWLLALLLAAAALWDLRVRRIPNGLVLAGLAAGLGVHLLRGGGPGLLVSLSGAAVMLPGLLLYALRVLGAGDIKLLAAVGALMGPGFLLWTLLGALLAGGLFALAWTLGHKRISFTLVPVSKARRMPFAPAIALGAIWACLHLKLL